MINANEVPWWWWFEIASLVNYRNVELFLTKVVWLCCISSELVQQVNVVFQWPNKKRWRSNSVWEEYEFLTETNKRTNKQTQGKRQIREDTTMDFSASDNGKGVGYIDAMYEETKPKTDDAVNGNDALQTDRRSKWRWFFGVWDLPEVQRNEYSTIFGNWVLYLRRTFLVLWTLSYGNEVPIALQCMVINMFGLSKNKTRKEVCDVMEVYGRFSWFKLFHRDFQGVLQFPEACEV